MRRRQFMAALGGAAAGLPLALHAAGQGGSTRHVGVLMTLPADDPEGQARIAAFLQGLQEAGWAVGRNLRIDIRWGASGPERSRSGAADLVALASDVILATGSTTLEQLLRATSTVPIVFVIVPDPVGAGHVASLARPGGNATGFLQFEYSLSGKWVELLKQVVPGMTRIVVIQDSTISAGVGQLGVIRSVAPAFGLEVIPVNVRDVSQIESTLASFAGSPDTGLILTSSPLAAIHRDLIVTLAARHKLPAVYYERYLATAGGLISYGPDFLDQYRRAVDYVDRILKGGKPANLPVQAPSKYELVINLKTAKALGITIPDSLLVRADEVIE